MTWIIPLTEYLILILLHLQQLRPHPLEVLVNCSHRRRGHISESDLSFSFKF